MSSHLERRNLRSAVGRLVFRKMRSNESQCCVLQPARGLRRSTASDYTEGEGSSVACCVPDSKFLKVTRL